MEITFTGIYAFFGLFLNSFAVIAFVLAVLYWIYGRKHEIETKEKLPEPPSTLQKVVSSSLTVSSQTDVSIWATELQKEISELESAQLKEGKGGVFIQHLKAQKGFYKWPHELQFTARLEISQLIEQQRLLLRKSSGYNPTPGFRRKRRALCRKLYDMAKSFDTRIALMDLLPNESDEWRKLIYDSIGSASTREDILLVIQRVLSLQTAGTYIDLTKNPDESLPTLHHPTVYEVLGQPIVVELLNGKARSSSAA